MRTSSPIDCLSAALHHAALQGLPPLNEEVRDLQAVHSLPIEERKAIIGGMKPYPLKVVSRRPHHTECKVLAMFGQTWGSTSLGFNGVGGAAMTTAYTVIIQGPQGTYAVYWDDRFAYAINPSQMNDAQIEAWAKGLTQMMHATCSMSPSRREAVELFGAQIPGPRVADEA